MKFEKLTLLGLIFLLTSCCLLSDIENCYEISQENIYIDSLPFEYVTPQDDSILGLFEDSRLVFRKFDADSFVYYSHQRRIGDIIIEKDCKRYIYDKNGDSLFRKKIRWRTNLPDLSYNSMSLWKLKRRVKGKIESVNLYLISPESSVFKIDPLPENPCWAVWSLANGQIQITVIDGVSGRKLGMGVPPPYVTRGFCISGPKPDDETLCEDPWTDRYESAAAAFELMGYSTLTKEFPLPGYISEQLRSDEIALFYEISHSSSPRHFRSGCPDKVYGSYIESWLTNYAKLPFVFLASCEAMCSTESGTLAYEFSKGLPVDAAVVGYCNMHRDFCDDAWVVSKDWQDEFFSYLLTGNTVFQSYNHAIRTYSQCTNCIDFYGDMSLRLVPKLKRSFYGSVEDNLESDLYKPHDGPLVHRSRRDYIRKYITVPEDKTFTIHRGARVVFIDNALLHAEGEITIDGQEEMVRFYTERDTLGTCKGVIHIQNGGCIRIYD